MAAFADAARHLSKAKEFLAAAAVSYESGLYNAATSDAVVCGIHCKDAICLVVTGRSAAGEAHQMAVAELDRSGPVGAGLSSTLNRLLRMKTKSQYSAESIGAGDAAKAVGWAERMLAAAEAVAAGR